LRLLQSRLVETWVDLGEDVALLDRLAFGKSTPSEPPVTWLWIEAVFSAITIPRPRSTMAASSCCCHLRGDNRHWDAAAGAEAGGFSEPQWMTANACGGQTTRPRADL